jgi:hypothetical protein
LALAPDSAVSPEKALSMTYTQLVDGLIPHLLDLENLVARADIRTILERLPNPTPKDSLSAKVQAVREDCIRERRTIELLSKTPFGRGSLQVPLNRLWDRWRELFPGSTVPERSILRVEELENLSADDAQQAANDAVDRLLRALDVLGAGAEGRASPARTPGESGPETPGQPTPLPNLAVPAALIVRPRKPKNADEGTPPPPWTRTGSCGRFVNPANPTNNGEPLWPARRLNTSSFGPFA